MSLRFSLAVVVAMALQGAGCAPSDTTAGEGATAARAAAGATFQAALSGAAEVPPNASPGAGSVTAALDRSTRVLTYSVEYAGTTGPVVAAHIHGPAAPGANAPPVVPLPTGPSPIRGTATLTEAQVADLEGGRYYVNLHTAAHPGGELRGQLTTAP